MIPPIIIIVMTTILICPLHLHNNSFIHIVAFSMASGIMGIIEKRKRITNEFGLPQ